MKKRVYLNQLTSKKKVVLRNLFLACLICSFTLARAQEKSIDLKYLGCAGFEITDGNITVLIDPYITRHKLGSGSSSNKADTRKNLGRSDYFESDTVSINKIIKKADYILITHSHFDHLSDVPYIAKRTGAKVIGHETANVILRSYGIPDKQLYTVKGGEDYQFEDFSVRIAASLHSSLGKKHYYDSRRYTERDELDGPLKVEDFIEGGSLIFLARFENHKILAMGSMNFIEREIQGMKPDIILAGDNYSRLEIYNYTERLMAATNFPKIVIPTHWDNFRIPYGFSQDDAIEKKVKPFIEEVKVASPESKVLIPVHLETITIKN